MADLKISELNTTTDPDALYVPGYRDADTPKNKRIDLGAAMDAKVPSATIAQNTADIAQNTADIEQKAGLSEDNEFTGTNSFRQINLKDDDGSSTIVNTITNANGTVQILRNAEFTDKGAGYAFYRIDDSAPAIRINISDGTEALGISYAPAGSGVITWTKLSSQRETVLEIDTDFRLRGRVSTLLNSLSAGGVYINATPAFSLLYDPGASYERVWSIEEDLHRGGAMYYGLGSDASEGVIKIDTDKNGTTTTATGTPAAAGRVNVIRALSNRVWAGFKASSTTSLYYSTDGVAYTNSGVTVTGDDCQNVIEAGSGRVVATFSAPLQVKYTDDGSSWSDSTGVATADTGYGLLYTSQGTVLIGAGTTAAKVLRSTDNAATFSTVKTLTQGSIFDIMENPIDSALYLITGTTKLEIWESLDDGATWALKFDAFAFGGYTLGFKAAFSCIGDLYVCAGSSADKGDILRFRYGCFAENPTVIDLGSAYELVRSVCITSRNELFAGTGTDSGDADVLRSLLFTLSASGDKNVTSNIMHHGVCAVEPGADVSRPGDLATIDAELHEYKSKAWRAVHNGDQEILYLTYDNATYPSYTFVTQNQWYIMPGWVSNLSDRIVWNAGDNSYDFNVEYFPQVFNGFTNLSASSPTGSHTFEIGIRYKNNGDSWPALTTSAGDALQRKPFTLDSVGGSVTFKTWANFTQRGDVQIIWRCTSAASKQINVSYGVKEIKRS